MNRQKIWAKSSWTKIKVLIVSVFLWPQQKPNTKSQALNITVRIPGTMTVVPAQYMYCTVFQCPGMGSHCHTFHNKQR